jgi:hypothetical protein
MFVIFFLYSRHSSYLGLDWTVQSVVLAKPVEHSHGGQYHGQKKFHLVAYAHRAYRMPGDLHPASGLRSQIMDEETE